MQPCLAPMIPAQPTALLDNPVAGDQESYRICANGGAYCPGGTRLTDPCCDLGIADNGPGRYLQQRLPYPQLKIRSRYLQ